MPWGDLQQTARISASGICSPGKPCVYTKMGGVDAARDPPARDRPWSKPSLHLQDAREPRSGAAERLLRQRAGYDSTIRFRHRPTSSSGKADGQISPGFAMPRYSVTYLPRRMTVGRGASGEDHCHGVSRHLLRLEAGRCEREGVSVVSACLRRTPPAPRFLIALVAPRQ